MAQETEVWYPVHRNAGVTREWVKAKTGEEWKSTGGGGSRVPRTGTREPKPRGHPEGKQRPTINEPSLAQERGDLVAFPGNERTQSRTHCGML